ncbi:uncharacterized protein METZ01_LOCUS106132 [marine metagenome]|uniref:Uncharacterized protein n=1 Tax=marine metagenome TaxID=408172 RepID=A0A381WM58_9ZZZZ
MTRVGFRDSFAAFGEHLHTFLIFAVLLNSALTIFLTRGKDDLKRCAFSKG